ncbi:MAG: N-acetylglucosamine-6-phosphate deacetylase [Erysipelotrichaceae bacterium]|nr:N-acetylglucosamine-6-phosphate deacetylase [Erysipelotrichaceae bacterium]
MILQSTRVYFEEKLQPLQIEVKGNKIINILPYGCNEEVLDYGDAIVLPGLIDMHNHGYYHGSCDRATKEWLKQWTSYLPSEGVTSTMFSFSCAPIENLIDCLKTVDEFIKEGYEGTQFAGVYTEGPYVGKMPGAQNLKYKLIPDRESIDMFNEACGGRLNYVMVAPEELDGNYDVIRYCRSKGMKVAIGHSGASFEVCKEAIQAGVSSFTHTFNGMTGLHHREPGVVGAAMYHDHCYCELICDGIHVNKVAANILARIKGKDRLMLVTDSVEVKGFEAGSYMHNGRELIIGTDGSVKMSNGTICGSCNRLNKVLRYAIKEAGIDPVTAYNAVTKNPFEFLGIANKGKISVGYDADLAIFDDEYDVIATYIAGKEFIK